MSKSLAASRLYLALKHLTFPGWDIGIRDRLKLARYFRSGDLLTLDAGCGNGAFSFVAYRLGNRVVSISLDAEAVSRCRKYAEHIGVPSEKVRFLVWNIYETEKLGLAFDQIICFETLEHLLRDADVVKTFARILTPGGVLHLCTPYRCRPLLFGEFVSQTEDGGHVRLGYTHEELEDLVIRGGLKPVVRDTVGGYGLMRAAAIHGRLQQRLGSRLPHLARQAVHMMLFWILSPLLVLDKLVNAPPVSVYLMAERK